MVKDSYKVYQFLPTKESVQSLFASLPLVSFLFCLYGNFSNGGNLKNKPKESDFQAPKKHLVVYAYLVSLLGKLDQFSNALLVNVVGRGYDQCSCSGKKGICRYNQKNIDPKDYFHAWNNTHENVPECSVEPYLLCGYVLPHMPWRYYLKVLWIPSNEWLNAWTHLIPALYFTWLFYGYTQSIDLLHGWPLLFVTSTAIALTSCSTVAHMFHSRSNYHHCCLFMLDYFGISLYAFSSTTAHFFASAELSYYSRIGWFNLIILLVIAGVGFYFCSLSQTGRKNSNTYHRQFKLWTNGIGYIYGAIPLLHRILTSEKEDPAFYYYIAHMVFMITSPILYASDFPQKYWPGKFDIIGHSHQIFHVVVALSCYFDIQGVYTDIVSQRWWTLKDQVDHPTVEVATSVFIVLIAYCLLVATYFSRKLKKCFHKELVAMFSSPVELHT